MVWRRPSLVGCILTVLTLIFNSLGGTQAMSDDQEVPGWSIADFNTYFTPPSDIQGAYIPLRDGMSQWVWMDAIFDPRKIERIVFTIHGYGRDVFNYAKHNSRARDAAAAGNATGNVHKLDPSTVLLMAPEFFGYGEQLSGALPTPDPNHQPCYNGSEWAWAMNSLCEDKTMSSFEAVDLLTQWMTDGKYPKLKTIVFTGHSLGGFFVHRYAMIGQPAQKPGLEYHYWIGNPAAYVYPDPYRPVKKSVMESCPTFDDWPYGLSEGFNTTYLGGQLHSADRLWTTYSSRYVHHVAGLKDDSKGKSGCEAIDVQASSHLERCFLWMARVMALHSNLSPNNTVDYLEDVQHDAAEMMLHPVSLFRLFYENHASNRTLPSHMDAVEDISNGRAKSVKWRALEDAKQKAQAAQEKAMAYDRAVDAGQTPSNGNGATQTTNSQTTSSGVALVVSNFHSVVILITVLLLPSIAI